MEVVADASDTLIRLVRRSGELFCCLVIADVVSSLCVVDVVGDLGI